MGGGDSAVFLEAWRQEDRFRTETLRRATQHRRMYSEVASSVGCGSNDPAPVGRATHNYGFAAKLRTISLFNTSIEGVQNFSRVGVRNRRMKLALLKVDCF